MFTVGDTFLYKTAGVCRIDDITTKDCGSGKKEYFVLKPVFDERSTLYIPSDSESFSSSVRSLLCEKEIKELIDGIPLISSEWITDDKERYEVFRSFIESGERKNLVKIIKAIHCHKKELSERGKRLRSNDETLLQKAERLFYGEIAFVLDMEIPDVRMRISEKLD